MTISARPTFVNSAFVGANVILAPIIYIRITRGLDLTDEMFYYGLIKGLIETERLFSNDLFIQQIVYILLYPIFYIYHLILGFDGFVLFGRVLMAVLSIAVFVYAYRKCLKFGFSFLVASMSALSLTFAIPYHGIFALSYNTISQAIWIIFVLRFFEWNNNSIISWGILVVVMAFAHPISAVTMSLLIFVRLLAERDSRRVVNLLLVLLSGALIVAPIIFYFATPQEYLASLVFSSGYGVGEKFFSTKGGPIALLGIYTMFGVCFLLRKLLYNVPFAIIIRIIIALSVTLLSVGLVGGAYTSRVVYVLSFLSASGYCWSLANIADGDTRLAQQINWLVVAILCYATTLAVTSSNGIGQATGAFMVGFPLLLGIAITCLDLKESANRYGYLEGSCMILVVALFVAHWSRYPYREDNWWKANQIIGSVPELRFISSSSERVSFIDRMRNVLQPVIKDRRTLIVSEFPGLYIAMSVRIETCILYMHSLESAKSEGVLLNCLRKKNPEVVIDIVANSDIAEINSRIKKVMRMFIVGRGLTCSATSIEYPSITRHNPRHLDLSVCK